MLFKAFATKNGIEVGPVLLSEIQQFFDGGDVKVAAES